MFLVSKLRRVRRANNLTANCEPIVLEILNISESYRPARPVKGIVLLYGDRVCFL
jgi:hypothetical protein